MQSGITVSQDLNTAFLHLLSNPSQFALPISINFEQLIPLDPIPSSSSLAASLSSLNAILSPKEPLYIILRAPSSGNDTEAKLYAITYIPSTSPVRLKTIFASTRTTLIRTLGLEKFTDSIFATDAEEVTSLSDWEERLNPHDGDSHEESERKKRDEREALLGEQERELEAVKRAEEAERFGAGGRGRDVGIGGVSAARGANGVAMNEGSEVRTAIAGIRDAEGGLVVLSMDIKTETILVSSQHTNITPSSLSSQIPASEPSFIFYNYPSAGVVFIYTCPTASSIKQRMVYACTRNFVVNMAGEEGVNVVKKLEGAAPEDFSESRLKDEVVASQDEGPKKGFARPKRPGRR